MNIFNPDWWKDNKDGLPVLVDRKERLVLKTTVDKSLVDKVRGNYLVKRLGAGDIPSGDTVEATYTLNINYIGDCVEMINAFLELQQAGAVIKCSTEELNYGYCMVEQLFEAIKQIRQIED